MAGATGPPVPLGLLHRLRLHEFASLPSTMVTALEHAAEGEGTVVWAHEQTAGRGRGTRPWISHAGAGLWFTLVLDAGSVSAPGQAPLVCGLGVLRGLQDWGVERSRMAIKWPNDVLYNGRKLAGLLLQRHGDRVLCGVGVNGCADAAMPDDVRTQAAHLAETAAQPPAALGDQVKQLAATIMEHYNQWLEQGFVPFASSWRQYDALADQEICYQDRTGLKQRARAVGLAADGGLRVVDRAGQPQTIHAGEVTVVRPALGSP